MKRFNVLYAVVTSHEVTIKAKNQIEAGRQAKDILGDDISIDGIWELTNEKTKAR